jgi:hypothetical protein
MATAKDESLGSPSTSFDRNDCVPTAQIATPREP